MEVRKERQQNPVADEVSALVAVTRPIIVGLLHSVGEEYLKPHGGREGIRLADIGRVRKQNDGDLGVAFEYAVHDAILGGESIVLDRVQTALKMCNITQGDPDSILFAMEKTGSKQLLSTRRELITPNSRVLSGKQGQPVKLANYLNQLAAAFHRPTTRAVLPRSIQGLWKADLFLGSQAPDHWVGTTVKINPSHLESGAGLRIAIVPTGAGRSDAVRKDEQKNLMVCPIPHDFSFMQTFYEGMRIVQALVSTDFRTPKEPLLPNPTHREVARMYVERREFSAKDVIEAMGVFAQPHLLEGSTTDIGVESFNTQADAETTTVLAPFARLDSGQ